jgi:transposase
MSLKPELVPPIPEETKRIAESAFPKGSTYMRMRDELGTLYQDEQFASLFPPQGQPAESPWRLALICVMQFAENLSDRQTADAVRARIDWKYALSLELTDSGFDFSVLSEFRTRLLDGGMEQELLDTMLTVFQEHGMLKQRGEQRTDSSHVVAAIRGLNRLESVGETLRATLNSLASATPEWLSEIAHPDWFDRYGKRIEEYRLPKGENARRELAEVIGVDGMILLDAIYSEASPDWLREIPAVETLRRVWVHQYYVIEGQLRLRKAKDLPPASLRFDSPYDPEAHYSTKRDIHWTGYKVHITETCDKDTPMSLPMLRQPSLHNQMWRGRNPSIKLSLRRDSYPANIWRTVVEHQVELVGRVKDDIHWQTKDEHAYSIDTFDIDWEAKTVTCPQGQTTKYWKPAKDANGNDIIVIRFSRPGCRDCESRSRCTRAKKESRSLTLRPQAQHEAIQKARKEQKTPQWKERYNKRAGIEGTISQGVRGFGLRQARYIGLAKTHLQNTLTAAAINIARIDDWLTGTPLAKTRTSRFKAMEARAA